MIKIQHCKAFVCYHRQMKAADVFDQRYVHIVYEQCKLVAANVAMEDLSGASEEQVRLTLLYSDEPDAKGR